MPILITGSGINKSLFLAILEQSDDYKAYICSELDYVSAYCAGGEPYTGFQEGAVRYPGASYWRERETRRTTRRPRFMDGVTGDSCETFPD